MEAIERSVGVLAKRVRMAEGELERVRIRLAEGDEQGGRENKKRRSEGSPSVSSPSSVSSLSEEEGYENNGRANGHTNGNGTGTTPMTLCLDDIPPLPSIPSTTSEFLCPTCGRPSSFQSSNTNGNNGTQYGYNGISPDGSPLVVPPGPLTAAAFESGMSAVEELKLLKAQVQDVARVCKVRASEERYSVYLFWIGRRTWRPLSEDHCPCPGERYGPA